MYNHTFPPADGGAAGEPDFGRAGAAGLPERGGGLAAERAAAAATTASVAAGHALSDAADADHARESADESSHIFFVPIFANFWRGRSRLYQNEILQENIGLTAFFKLYKICILLYRCNLKFLAKNLFERSPIFVKIQQKKCKCCKICKILPYFKNCS